MCSKTFPRNPAKPGPVGSARVRPIEKALGAGSLSYARDASKARHISGAHDIVGPTMHRLTNINRATLRATCETCGPDSQILVRDKVKGYYRCREARKGYRRQTYARSRYGLSWNEYQRLKQDGSCYVCGTVEDLVIDHCHETGLLRGVLCNMHNKALGLLQDNPAYLDRLLNYLDNPPLRGLR